MDIDFLFYLHMGEGVRGFLRDSLWSSWLHSIHEGSTLMISFLYVAVYLFKLSFIFFMYFYHIISLFLTLPRSYLSTYPTSYTEYSSLKLTKIKTSKQTDRQTKDTKSNQNSNRTHTHNVLANYFWYRDIFIYSFMWINVLTAYMCVYVPCNCLTPDEVKGIKTLGPGIADGCKLTCGCWDLNPGPSVEKKYS